MRIWIKNPEWLHYLSSTIDTNQTDYSKEDLCTKY